MADLNDGRQKKLIVYELKINWFQLKKINFKPAHDTSNHNKSHKLCSCTAVDVCMNCC